MVLSFRRKRSPKSQLGARRATARTYVRAEEKLRILLESKHLYQSVKLDREVLKAEAGELQFMHPRVDESIDEALDSEWRAHDEVSVRRPGWGGSGSTQLPPARISFYLESIKTSCSICSAVTPFNLARQIDVYRREGTYGFGLTISSQQDFVLLYGCQSCKSVPDTFLVRRKSEKLTLAGRAPMELPEVPESIPKEVRKYYSNAVVAFQSGQILAGIFLLRVLIEQHARVSVKGGAGMKADEVIGAYQSRLPEGLKNNFPSLRAVYSDLSSGVHSASEDEGMFESSRERIKVHFNAIRVLEDSAKVR